jgi:hypothetical protein
MGTEKEEFEEGERGGGMEGIEERGKRFQGLPPQSGTKRRIAPFCIISPVPP